ncbi:MAG: gamma carbonic anhydrase family protein [Magnetococcales bacterium]|nr:gamma carbonic anhydrase family protein [Magnetococcales bacterium]
MPLYGFEGIIPRVHDSAFVHPEAVVIGDVEIGAGSSVWPGVVIRGDIHRIRIGCGTNIQDGSVLHVGRPTDMDPEGAPLIIGDRVTVGHLVILHGCIVENEAMVGMGSRVLDKARVGTGAMVGAGAMITPGKVIGPGELWVGSPARLLRVMSPAELQKIQATTENYIRLANRYR